MTARLDIEVPRNGDFYRTFELTDDDGVPINVSAHTLELQVRTAAGTTGTPAATATITKTPLTPTRFDIRLPGSAFSAIPGPFEVVRLSYDFRRTEPGGVKSIDFRGTVLLVPGDTI